MNRGVESKIIRALSEEVHKDTAWGFQVKNNAQLKSEWDARSQQDSYVREAQQDKDEARRSELRDKVSLYSGKALGTHGTLASVRQLLTIDLMSAIQAHRQAINEAIPQAIERVIEAADAAGLVDTGYAASRTLSATEGGARHIYHYRHTHKRHHTYTGTHTYPHIYNTHTHKHTHV
jgi:hypothetical protein